MRFLGFEPLKGYQFWIFFLVLGLRTLAAHTDPKLTGVPPPPGGLHEETSRGKS